ncbi:MAG: V-type ATPase subunit [Oscillospiraceae bacterium]|jgi:V/A-type H+-transporting ATPase subunit C|nr:V-type ATPase subunit [Oscillospiraceae bacterium]
MNKTAGNALYAKCHALFGKRLTEGDYAALLACKSVGDVAAYLKAHTPYADALADIHTPTVRRQQLELHLRYHLFQQIAALCRYEVSLGQSFYRYYIQRGEVGQVLNCLRLLSSEHQDDYLLTLPTYFQRFSDLDLFALAKSKTARDVLDACRHTDYYAILRPYLEKVQDKVPDLNAIELALDAYLAAQVLLCIVTKGDKSAKGKRVTPVRYLGVDADMKAIAVAYRLKKYLRANANQIRAKTDFSAGRLNEKQTDLLLDAPTEDEFMRRLRRTPYGKDFDKHELLYIEDATARVAYAHARKTFRYTMDAGVTTLAYLDLAENELKNLTHIIEGIRYAAPSEEIRKQLVGMTN